MALILEKNRAEPDGMNVFDAMGVYWAEIADQNQTQRQIQFLKNTLKKDGYVLDLACGTGRHSIALSREGYGMVGLDVSANLLKIAKQRSSAVELVRGDMRSLPFKPQAFAAALSMDTSLGYLPSERDDVQSFTEVQRTLQQGGVLVVDVFNREHLIQKYGHRRLLSRLKLATLPFLLRRHSRWMLFRAFKWKEYPSFFLLQKRTVSGSGDWLCDLWMVCPKAGGRLAVFDHIVRLYRIEQLQGLLESAGFAVVDVFGDYEGQDFSANSSRLILVATAR